MVRIRGRDATKKWSNSSCFGEEERWRRNRDRSACVCVRERERERERECVFGSKETRFV